MTVRRRRIRVAAGIATLGLGISACGIRVPHAEVVGAAGGGTGSTSGTSGQIATAATASGPAAAGTASASTVSPSGPGASPAAGVASGTPTQAGSSSAAAPSASPNAAPGAGGSIGAAATKACGSGRIGRGITAKTITLGLEYVPDASEANAGLGGSAWRSGEPDSDYAAFVKYFNSTGGICGRQIAVVPWNDQVISGETQNTQDQAACTAWTQDNQVFAADTNEDYPPVDACMKAAGSTIVQIGNIAQEDDPTMAQYPNVITPYTMSYSRFDPLFVNELAANGYFSKGAKVGLLYTQIPAEAAAVKASLIPALRAKGVTLVDSAEVANTVDIDSLSQAESQTDEAVLRFQSEGIDHVLAPFDGFSLGAFIGRAAQQGYAPRYGLSTSDAGNGHAGLTQNAQFDGALDVVWGPSINWADSQTNPGTAFCLNILKQEGVPAPADEGVFDLSVCDFLVFMRATLDKAPDLTEAGILSAAQSLGIQPGDAAFEWAVSPDRRDGVAGVRLATFSGGNSGSWRYLTPLTPTS